MTFTLLLITTLLLLVFFLVILLVIVLVFISIIKIDLRVSIYLYNQDRSSYEGILVTSGCSSSEDSKSFAAELSCGLSTSTPGKYVFNHFNLQRCDAEYIEMLAHFKQNLSLWSNYGLQEFDIIYRSIGDSPLGHSGIYLGNNQVVHVKKSSNYSYVAKDSLEDFRGGKAINQIVRFLIPFSKKEEIIRRIERKLNKD